MDSTFAPLSPPFRAEHIGSLLRPEAILVGENPEAHIVEVIRWQERLGLKVVTDGEFRRESWRLGFVSKVKGFARADAVGDVDLQRDDAGNVARVGSAPLALTKVKRTGPIVADEVLFSLRNTKCTVKATLPAPSYLHYPRGRACVDPKAYPDLEEFFSDVVDVYVQELQALHEVGGRYVQIDEVAQPLLCDETLRDAVRARGGYERIAERAFGALEADAFFLEYDSARAGGFEPLRFVPQGKHVVLGLVSTKTPVLEAKDFLKRRIDEAARFVPLEKLSISPQCGFASHRKGTALSFADQEAKLRLVVETAQEVWGSS